MTERAPMCIDAQVHAYERDRPERPWTEVFHGPPEVSGNDLVQAMDAVGVDGAILVSVYTLYRYDASYAVEVQAHHPDRFGVIRPVDPNDPDVIDAIREWAALDGSVGIRLMLANEPAPDERIDAVLATAGGLDLPVNVFCPGRLAIVTEMAQRHPDTQLVVDHLGLAQPFTPPVPAEPFADLPAVLSLADAENIAIKITGAGTLSHQRFPFPDLWPHLDQIFERFGLERCLWGTDWTRSLDFLTYQEGVDAFRLTERLSDADRATLMGGTASRIYRWAPGHSPTP